MFLFKKHRTLHELFVLDDVPSFCELISKILKSISWYTMIGMIYASIIYNENMKNSDINYKIATWPITATWDITHNSIQYVKGHKVSMEWPDE